MIPDIPQIRDSLAGLGIREGHAVVGDGRQATICERQSRISADGSVAQDTATILLVQSQDAPLALPRLIDRVASELHGHGHAHCAPKTDRRSSLATKVLGLSVAIQHLFPSPLESLNLLFKHITEAQVIQWAVLVSSSTGSDQYRFGDFSYGELDLSKLKSRSERAGSNYFQLHGDPLRGRRSICRESRRIKILDCSCIEMPGNLDAVTKEAIYRIIDDYYGDVASGEQQVFLADLDRQQSIYGAAGLGTISADTLLRLSSLSQWITIFTRQEKRHGWVVPIQAFFEISTTEPKALSDGQVEITQHLKLQDWQKRPLDASIQSYCHYITAAQDYDRNGRVEEALLHLIFGLDLLLGGESADALTRVLAERTAVVSHVALKRPFQEVTEFVRDCYDLRSGYVHRGGKGAIDETKSAISLRDRLDQLSDVARVVLGAACFARLQEWCHEEDARNAWVKRVDVLRAKQAAGLGIDDADLVRLGLKQVRMNKETFPCVTITE